MIQAEEVDCKPDKKSVGMVESVEVEGQEVAQYQAHLHSEKT